MHNAEAGATFKPEVFEMVSKALVTTVLLLCSCTSAVRTTKLELIDSAGATVAELGRSDGITSLRFYEYPDGTKCTTLEMESHAVDDRSEIVEVLSQLGYHGNAPPRAVSRVILSPKDGIRAELSSDRVIYYGKDGSVLWVVKVWEPFNGAPLLEFYDGDGKALFSTAGRQ